jgi:hypothetical protein
MPKEDYSEEIRDAAHKAMVRHLDGTPNDELRELIEDYRTDMDRVQDGDFDGLMSQARREGFLEGMATVCNALEHLIEDE